SWEGWGGRTRRELRVSRRIIALIILIVKYFYVVVTVRTERNCVGNESVSISLWLMKKNIGKRHVRPRDSLPSLRHSIQSLWRALKFLFLAAAENKKLVDRAIRPKLQHKISSS